MICLPEEVMLWFDELSLCRDLNEFYEKSTADKFMPIVDEPYFNTTTKPILQTEYG